MALLIEAQRGGEILVGHRPPVGAACDVDDDALRTRLLFVGAVRITDEDLVPRRSVVHAGRMVRPDHLETEHAGRARQVVRPQRLQRVIGFGQSPGDIGQADLVRPGRDIQLHPVEALADDLHRIGLLLIDVLQVFLAADLGRVHLLAIERHDQLLLAVEAGDIAAAEAGALVDVEGVLAIRREQMLDEQAAARAQRQAGDVHLLIGAGSAPDLDAGSRRGGTADRRDTHVMRRIDVLIEK